MQTGTQILKETAMYMFRLRDGTVLATSSKYMISYIRDTYGKEPGISTEWFDECLDRAIAECDYVIE